MAFGLSAAFLFVYCAVRCRLHPAGRGPNSDSLFPPLALGLRLLLFLQPLGGDFEKAERCPSLASLHLPLAAVGSATVVAVAPSRGASGETVHFAGTAKASPR